MGAYMPARTLIVDPSIGTQDFKDADELREVNPIRLSPETGLKTFQGMDSWVINLVYGKSRSNVFCWSVAEISKRLDISGLEFLFGELSVPSRWQLPLGIEDGEDEIYGYCCGYWFEGEQLIAAHDNLAKTLELSKKKIAKLTGLNNVGDWSRNEVLKAINLGMEVGSPDIRRAVHDEDGDGPHYLFGYLGTALHVFSNAIASNNAVLHLADIYI